MLVDSIQSVETSRSRFQAREITLGFSWLTNPNRRNSHIVLCDRQLVIRTCANACLETMHIIHHTDH
jgi:hypothetical protein